MNTNLIPEIINDRLIHSEHCGVFLLEIKSCTAINEPAIFFGVGLVGEDWCIDSKCFVKDKFKNLNEIISFGKEFLKDEIHASRVYKNDFLSMLRSLDHPHKTIRDFLEKQMPH